MPPNPMVPPPQAKPSSSPPRRARTTLRDASSASTDPEVAVVDAGNTLVKASDELQPASTASNADAMAFIPSEEKRSLPSSSVNVDPEAHAQSNEGIVDTGGTFGGCEAKVSIHEANGSVIKSLQAADDVPSTESAQPIQSAVLNGAFGDACEEEEEINVSMKRIRTPEADAGDVIEAVHRNEGAVGAVSREADAVVTKANGVSKKRMRTPEVNEGDEQKVPPLCDNTIGAADVVGGDAAAAAEALASEANGGTTKRARPLEGCSEEDAPPTKSAHRANGPLVAYEAFVARWGLADDDDTQVAYQVFEDLRLVRKWTGLRAVVLPQTAQVAIWGVAPHMADAVYAGLRARVVLPMAVSRRPTVGELHALCGEAAESDAHGQPQPQPQRCATLAIVDDDSTTAYYRLFVTWDEVTSTHWKQKKERDEEAKLAANKHTKTDDDDDSD